LRCGCGLSKSGVGVGFMAGRGGRYSLEPSPKVYSRVIAWSRPPVLGLGSLTLGGDRWDAVGSIDAVSASYGLWESM
jgi:hypothetical protein